MTILRLALIACAAIAATAAPAAAATVEVRLVDESAVAGYPRAEWRLIYTAAPGERNDVRLRGDARTTIRVADAGAVIAAGDRCRSVDDHTAECSIPEDHPSAPGLSPYLTIAHVAAGDRDDRVQVEEQRLALPQLVGDGGPGDDVLVGGDGGDDLDGGGGRDRLVGNDNVDDLTDGDTPGAVDADVLDGGADGSGDTVSYASRTADLLVDLADTATDGERDEGDRLVGIDNVIGGAGDDDIGGGPGSTSLEGGAGDDHLDGEGGEDWLQGGPGRDRLHGHADRDGLDGGPGRDRLRGDGGDDFFIGTTSQDVLLCGPGADSVHNTRGAFARPDCEAVGFTFSEDGEDRGALVDGEGAELRLTPHPVLTRTGRSLIVVLGCPQPVGSAGTCGQATGTLTVTTPAGVPIGSGAVIGRFRDEAGEPETMRVRVALGSRGRRLAAARRAVRMSIRGAGLPTARWTARVRRASR